MESIYLLETTLWWSGSDFKPQSNQKKEKKRNLSCSRDGAQV
jgi:hypothetical protein